MQKGRNMATDPEVAAITDFCGQALQDAWLLAQGKSPKDIIK
jgi:hypothetical protein